MRDIACAQYVAGCNTTFFGHQPNQKISDRYTAARARQQLMRRLSFADEVGARYQSCLAFPLGASKYESGELDTVMSVTTRLLPWEVNTNNVNSSFPGGSAMFQEYQRILALNQIHYGEDVRAAENMEFISQVRKLGDRRRSDTMHTIHCTRHVSSAKLLNWQGATNNALCFMGPHRKFSRISRSHFELVPGQGHFGPDALPGDARWRRGESISLKSARDQMVSLEAVASSQLAFQPRG